MAEWEVGCQPKSWFSFIFGPINNFAVQAYAHRQFFFGFQLFSFSSSKVLVLQLFLGGIS